MLATVLTVGVYIICISTGITLIVEIYRFVKSKFVKEPEAETTQTTANLFDLPDLPDLPDSKEPPKRIS